MKHEYHLPGGSNGRIAENGSAFRAVVIHEDDDFVIVDKPAGQFVHASPGHEYGTLAQALAGMYPEMARIGSAERPGVVHRLDAQTSGVMVFARTRRGYAALRRAFESHEKVRKTYLAILHGTLREREGTLVADSGRKPWDPKRMAVGVEGGKRSVTHWTTLARKNGLSLVEFAIETGRTHQIRVVAAHLGAPVAGDELYGDGKADRRMRKPPGRHLLHAVTLEFPHPATGRMVAFSAPPPPDFTYAM